MLKSIVLIICFGSVVIHVQPALDESSATKFIIELSDKFFEAYSKLEEGIFKLTDFDDDSTENIQISSENKNSIRFELGLLIQTTAAYKNIITLAEEAFKFPVDQLTDEEVEIGIMKLKTIHGIAGLGDEYSIWLRDFQVFLKYKNFCKLKKEETCNYSHSDLMEILKTSSDPDEILFYWKEWRERNAKSAADKMPKFIQMFKKLGEKYGKNGKFAWFADYLDENFDIEMEKAVHDLEPLYKELHAHVRHNLHQQYGDKVSETGLIPHHLYEQAMSHAWIEDSFISKEFKDVRMPIQNNFNETAKEIMNIASNFLIKFQNDKVEVKDINKHYWDLMAKYVGVSPPVERTSETIDFPYNFYKNMKTNYQTIKFISEVMGYQVYKSLCEKSGEYVKGDKTLQLHNCNIHNSKEAGTTLKHMMQLGSKKPWKKLLGTITGDDSGMKAEPMLEYYEPLQKWLHKKNSESDVTPGW